MKDKISIQEINTGAKIKVRLDSKTIMIMNNLASLDVWKVKYPDAKIM